MSGSASLEDCFPGLKGFKGITWWERSAPTWAYNCFAFALGRTDVWYSPKPGYYWPRGIPKGQHVKNLVLLHEKEGFALCDDGLLEEGVEKIALYADGQECTHVALQAKDGKWWSKCAQDHDIEHESLDVLVGEQFGTIAHFMKRARKLA